jgi:hypothetical protein
MREFVALCTREDCKFATGFVQLLSSCMLANTCVQNLSAQPALHLQVVLLSLLHSDTLCLYVFVGVQTNLHDHSVIPCKKSKAVCASACQGISKMKTLLIGKH